MEKNSLAARLHAFRSGLGSTDSLLVLVSKGQADARVMEAYAEGVRHFGESRVQALAQRAESLPRDIHWHMIGHLQRNKVKYIAPFVHRIHSVDSLALLAQIDKEARRSNRLLHCLLQVRIAQETSKYGFETDEVRQLLSSDVGKDFPYVSITGLMGMATRSKDNALVLAEFRSLKVLFDRIRTAPYAPKRWSELSMGMSDDYSLALQTGANVIRIGRAIFGTPD